MRRSRTHTAAVAMTTAVLTFTVTLAEGQTARSGSGGNAQLLQQMQQLASERTSLQAENAKLTKDLENVRKERDALKNAQQAFDRRAKSSEEAFKQNVAQRESTERELTQTKEKLQQLVSKFRETLQSMRDIEMDRANTKQTLAAREQSLKVCIDRNLALYNLNQEVLTRFEHQSVWTRVAQIEPFTRIKRVQLENLIDDYKQKADEQRIAPASTPAPSSGPTNPNPSSSTANSPEGFK